MKHALSTLLIFLYSLSIIAQRGGAKNPCGTKYEPPTGLQVDYANSTRLIDENGLIIIPVVFHIVYNNAAENLSNAVIQSQLNRLNEDFRKLNADIVNTPFAWQGITADIKIEFRLACVDPTGQLTDGITRTFTSSQHFNPTDQVKSSNTGGIDPWPTDTYLNIWICDIDDMSGIVGEAKYPWTYAANPHLDGIVLDYTVAGTNTLHPNFNLGRIAVHEIGHWLGLFHIHGGPTFCSVDVDFIPDTPTSGKEDGYLGLCPTGEVLDICNPVSPGDMYMNYMQYTNDPCKLMFTEGQRSMMRNFIAAPGLDSRYPFLDNYFGMVRFTSSPVIVANNQIIIKLKNPACIPVQLVSLNGPVTIQNITSDEVVLYVDPCVNSGVVDIALSAENYIDEYDFVFQDINFCSDTWPKVYSDSRSPLRLLKDNGGNFLVKFAPIELSGGQILNHAGPISPSNGISEHMIFHYSNDGLTYWYRETNGVNNSSSPNIVLNNGNLQWKDYSYSNLVTGNTATPPPLVPSGEQILAETNGGHYITSDANNIYVHGPGGPTSTAHAGPPYEIKFNKTTNKLFTIKYNSLAQSYEFKIYQLTGANLTQLVNTTINASGNPVHFAQIDNQDRVFVVRNNVFQKYDYTTNTFADVTIGGLINSDISGLNSNNPYTENKCLIINRIENMIYSIDVSSSTSKKIAVSNFPYDPFGIQREQFFYYAYEGDFVYLAGHTTQEIPNNTLVIGIQQVEPYGDLDRSVFFTKFSLLTDFSRLNEKAGEENSISNLDVRQKNIKKGVRISLSPNPTSNLLYILLSTPETQKPTKYLCQIIDNAGRLVSVRECNTGLTVINTKSLPPGSYYVLITSDKGHKSSKIFVKQ